MDAQYAQASAGIEHSDYRARARINGLRRLIQDLIVWQQASDDILFEFHAPPNPDLQHPCPTYHQTGHVLVRRLFRSRLQPLQRHLRGVVAAHPMHPAPRRRGRGTQKDPRQRRAVGIALQGGASP